mmetsp:Transcript_25030/g.48943  ORF Transcript_25030/g.48943 Transcript_25030/m.48943 type:complete len:505 (+) Transcript_25030:42-1556(+)
MDGSCSRKRRTRCWCHGRSKRLRLALGFATVLTEPSQGVNNNGRDNEEHDLICSVGDVVRVPGSGVSYDVLGSLGRGTFGQVLKCRSSVGDRLAALKIIKHEAFCHGVSAQAEEEVKVLRRLNTAALVTGGSGGSGHLVRMLDAFVHHGHICIAFELLGPDLLQVLQQHGKPGLPLDFIEAAAEQLLAALEHLQTASVIHGDLKPENVLLTSLWRYSQRPRFKIIDFGAAQIGNRVAETEDVIIQTLPYRAPEVLLGLAYTHSVDMWSFGCICAELVLGKPLFPHGGSEHDIVRNTLELLGPIPEHMLHAGRNTGRYFHRTDRVLHASAAVSWVELLRGCRHRRKKAAVSRLVNLLHGVLPFWRRKEATDTKKYDYNLKSLRAPDLNEERITSLERAISLLRYQVSYTFCLPRRLKPEMLESQRVSRSQLLDFLLRCLRTNPDERWNPLDAKRHLFVRRNATRSSSRLPRSCSVGLLGCAAAASGRQAMRRLRTWDAGTSVGHH